MLRVLDGGEVTCDVCMPRFLRAFGAVFDLVGMYVVRCGDGRQAKHASRTFECMVSFCIRFSLFFFFYLVCTEWYHSYSREMLLVALVDRVVVRIKNDFFGCHCDVVGTQRLMFLEIEIPSLRVLRSDCIGDTDLFCVSATLWPRQELQLLVEILKPKCVRTLKS